MMRHTRPLIIFLVILVAIAAPLEAAIIAAGSLRVHGGGLVYALMWAPALAAMIAKLLTQGSLVGLGWRLGDWRYTIPAYCLPLAAAGALYGGVWLSGWGALNADVVSENRWLAALLTTGSIHFLISAVFAFGEELGWRGFLAPELARRFSLEKTILVSGSLWALYHFPLLLWADYHAATPVAYAMVMFSISIFSVTVIATWLRFRSGSVWPAVILHASHNVFVQGFFDPATRDTGWTQFITTEFGAGLAVLYALTAGLIWRHWRTEKFNK